MYIYTYIHLYTYTCKHIYISGISNAFEMWFDRGSYLFHRCTRCAICYMVPLDASKVTIEEPYSI